jgi:KamA family protein
VNRNQLFSQYTALAERENLLPIKVTPFYKKKIDEEIAAIGYGGPLYKGSYPTEERLNLRAPGEVPDFVQDYGNMPEGLRDVVIQKYEDRILFFPTESCAGHCQYCFRTYVLSEENAIKKLLPDLQSKLNGAIVYVNQHPTIREVIFSGGDPMTIRPTLLETALRRFKEETTVTDLRIHTRTIVFTPNVFREKVCELLGQYRVRVYFHIIHPYEVDETVAASVSALQKCGVRTYNQFPLLRGVNDHPDVLATHVEMLDRMGIRQVSMFIPDPINYSATFRISLERLFRIIDEFNWKTPSWVNAGRVAMDTPVGKVRRENIAAWDKTTGEVLFEREGNQVKYIDFPEDLDVPGDILKMLWKTRMKTKDRGVRRTHNA